MWVEISGEINNVGLSNHVIGVEIMRVQDPSLPLSSLRLPFQPTPYIKSSMKINIHPHQFPKETIIVAYTNFELKIWHGLKTNMGSRE